MRSIPIDTFSAFRSFIIFTSWGNKENAVKILAAIPVSVDKFIIWIKFIMSENNQGTNKQDINLRVFAVCVKSG
ncbi:MAG: hypothetical protein ABIT58_01750 [Ferruginibacter sp.]